MSQDTAWPPSNGLCSPTVPRKDAVFSISHSLTIAAPASEVFEHVLHIADYEKWNTWVPNAKIVQQPSAEVDFSHLQTGSIFEFYVIMDAAKPSKTTTTGLMVTDISTPGQPTEYIDQDTREKDGSYTADLSKVYRVSWKTHGGFASRGLRSERFHEIIARGENQCEVRTWEVMGGFLAYTVKWMFQKTLDDKFKLWCEDLKRYSEEKAGATV
ncbi:hypothetical protein HII31_00746 [Pseudocercospora fuligena]|uniref:Coenzyme Q-binding protein COQ10 START domain-containing protein n=1 Tax=Pseudocercospora fuligena TaxID=685502 RepID=A0A8H6RV89_9PEZI|nr:hypothetical protein HII31_00746 [Pseudocercospora fuligena]